MSTKKWQVGDKPFVIYRYVDDGGTVVQAEVVEKPDKRGYLTVCIPGLFGPGPGFKCLCITSQLFETATAAKAARSRPAKVRRS